MKIVDDIYQLKVPMKHNPLGYTYSYFLKDSNTLIDTGIPSWDSFISFDKQITELEANTRDIERVIITNMHNDHVGLIE